MRTPDQRKDTPKGNGFITADIEAANKFLSLKASRTYSENSKINVLGGDSNFRNAAMRGVLAKCLFLVDRFPRFRYGVHRDNTAWRF